MSYDTIFDGTSLSAAESVAFSTAGPAVHAGPGPGPGSGASAEAEGRLEVGAGVWIACCEASGVVEIHNPGLFRPGREAFCRALAESAVERFQARRVDICLTSSMCRLKFRPGAFDRTELARRIAEAVRAATPTIRNRVGTPPRSRASWTTLTAFAANGGGSIRRRREDRPGRVVLCDAPAPAKQPPETPNGGPRLVDLALAGGSLTMAVAGAILPGIPSLPFLVLTARYAARLAPGIDRYLRCRPWFAALLSQAEAPGNPPRLDGRSLRRALPIIIPAVAVFLIVRPPLPVVMVLEIGVMAFVCCRELERPGVRGVALGVPAQASGCTVRLALRAGSSCPPPCRA